MRKVARSLIVLLAVVVCVSCNDTEEQQPSDPADGGGSDVMIDSGAVDGGGGGADGGAGDVADTTVREDAEDDESPFETFLDDRSEAKATYACAIAWGCPELATTVVQAEGVELASKYESEEACRNNLPVQFETPSSHFKLRADVKSGRISFDDQQGDQCVSAWEDWGTGDACQKLKDRVVTRAKNRTLTDLNFRVGTGADRPKPAACESLFSGRGTDGDTCVSSEACAEGLTCDTNDSVCRGTCVSDDSGISWGDKAQGEECQVITQCQQGLYCSSQSGTCEPLKEKGQSCSGTNIIECELGLRCAATESSGRECIEPYSRGQGEACASGPRSSFINDTCEPGLICNDGTCESVVLKQSEAECAGDMLFYSGSDLADGGICEPGSRCYSGQAGGAESCVSYAADGEDCDGELRACKPGLSCGSDDTCAGNLASGEACGGERPTCGYGLSCSDDVVPQQCVSAGRCNPKEAFEGEPEFVGRTVPPGVSSLPAERWVFRGETGADGRIYAAGTYYDNFDGDSGQGGSGAFIAADDNPVDGYLEDKAVLDSESDELGVAGAGDSDGNMYMAVTTDGAYASDASGGPGDGNLEYSAASGIPTDLSVPSDVVVAKFDDAEERQWVGVVGEGNDQSHRATGIDTDASGNPYVVGHYQTDTDAWNVFVAKFDGSGNLAWRTNLPTDHEDETFPGDPATPDNDYQDIEVKDGTVYVAADRGADATSGDGNLPATPNGHAAAMIVTLDLQGNVQQTNYVEAESGVYWRGVGVAVDSNGDTYLVGTSDSDRFASDDDEHLFVAKFDASGTQKWVRGYLNVEASNVGGDWIGDIAIAPNDTLFIAGAVDTTNETVLQLDASGNQRWAVSFDDELGKYPRYTVFDLAVSDRYGVFVFGSKTFQRTTAGSYSDVMFGLIK